MLDVLFSPLLSFNPALSVFIFSAIVITLINVFQKVLVKQHEAKQIKEKLQSLNAEIKQAQKEDNKQKVNELFSEIMRENNRLMGMSMKPMMASLVIVAVFLPWIASAYGDMETSLNEGSGKIEIRKEAYEITKNGNDLQIGDVKCTLPCRESIGGYEWNIISEGSKIKFSRIVAFLPIGLPLVGNELGWLGWYFLSSIPIVIVLRKALKISI